MASKALKLKRKFASKQRVLNRRLARQYKYASNAYVSGHVESFMLKDLWSILFHGRDNLLVRGINLLVEDEELKTADKIELMAAFMLEHEEALRPEVLEPALLKEESWQADFTESYFDDQLLSMIFHVKNVGSFALERFKPGVTLEESKQAKNYSGIEFFNCYRFAKKAYGLVDAQSGQRIPFMQFFNFYYKFKKNNILKENKQKHNFEDTKIKARKLKTLLAEAYAAVGKNPQAAPDIEVSYQWMEDKLKELAAPEKFFEEMEYIFNNSFVSFSEAAIAYRDEDGEPFYLVDINEKDSYEVKHQAIFKLWDTVETARRELQAAGKLKDLALVDALLTIKIAPFYKQLDVVSQEMCKDFIDPDLFAYLENAELPVEGKERDLDALFYAQFKDLKYNTARKKLNLIRNYLKDFYRRK